MQPWLLLRKRARCCAGLLPGIYALQTGFREKGPKGVEKPECAQKAHDLRGNRRRRAPLGAARCRQEMNAMNGKPWLLLDTETTGFTAPVFVVELAAQRMLGWEADGEPFLKLLNQNQDIPAEASR